MGPKRVLLEVERFGKLTPAVERALRAETERYARFAELPVTLR